MHNTVEPVFFFCAYLIFVIEANRENQNLVLAKFLYVQFYCVRYDFDSIAMWLLLQVLDTLLLGAMAWLQQYDRLVLAISREI